MKQTSAVNKLHPQLRREATDWLIAFCEGEVDASGRKSFDRWLRSSPEHVRAYLQISALWEGAGLLAENTEAEVEKGTRRAQSPVWQGIAACLLLVSAIAGGMLWWQSTRAPTYQSAASEQRTVRLPDGSTVQLNARTKIALRFTARARAVDLIEGQALFRVAKDSKRAFVVRSDAARVKAVGTRFDVYRKSSGTIVTVIEGQVAIGLDTDPPASARGQPRAMTEVASTVPVSAGEQAVASAGAPIHVYRTNVFAATAWTEGKLMFESTPLREVVAEFNRIDMRRLVIEDDSLLALHVTGVFPTADPSQLVAFLRHRFGLTVKETDNEMRLSGAARK
jgi:transmembrane sensor